MDYIYNLVNEQIERYGTRNPFEICDDCEIYVKFTENLKNLSGMYTVTNDIPVIVINSNKDEYMQKMVCAHELGHHFLHSEVAKEKCLQEFEIFNMCDRIEYEANIFASHLLIDEKRMISLFREGYDSFYTAKMFDVDPNLLNIKLTDMNRMGWNFNTSWSGTRMFR